MHASSLIVIGASAGGMPALTRLAAQLPAGLQAAVLAVQHLPPGHDTEAFAARLSRHTALSCRPADSGAELENGVLYLARPDRHLLVSGRRIALVSGARENRYRPAVDALFRSAAVAWGRKVAGVVLTGMLHDGTAGLEFIKRCGGLTVVQDPEEAEYPSMPATAMGRVQVDHVAGLERMGPLLAGLAERMSAMPSETEDIPPDLKLEAAIALRAASTPADVAELGRLACISCPECGGTLWEMEHGDVVRFRCHTGHVYSGSSMLESAHEQLEESLWAALRLMEEQRMLLERMEARNQGVIAGAERLGELGGHIAKLRQFITGAPDPGRQ